MLFTLENIIDGCFGWLNLTVETLNNGFRIIDEEDDIKLLLTVIDSEVFLLEACDACHYELVGHLSAMDEEDEKVALVQLIHDYLHEVEVED